MIEKLMAFEDSLMGNVVNLVNPPAPRLSPAERIKAANG